MAKDDPAQVPLVEIRVEEFRVDGYTVVGYTPSGSVRYLHLDGIWRAVIKDDTAYFKTFTLARKAEDRARGKWRKLRVWTEAYRPFMMGGDVNAPIGAEVTAEGPIPLGKSVFVYVVASPSDTIHIAEASTGAFIGTSLTQVREDFRTAKISVVRKQIAAAKERMERVDWVGEARFWAMFREKR